MALWDTIPYSLRQLQYLVAVADLGGFRKAAEACGVAQPSMSAQIAQVEQAIGVQIFERSARGVRVTAAGAAVIDRARAVLLASRDLADTARQHRDPLQRHAAHRGDPDRLPVPPARRHAGRCKRSLPDLQIDLERRQDAHPDATRSTRRGLDAAILALDARVAAMEHVVIGVDEFVLAGAKNHALVHGAAARLAAGPRRRDGAPARRRSLFSRSGARVVRRGGRPRRRSARHRTVNAGANGRGGRRRDVAAVARAGG